MHRITFLLKCLVLASFAKYAIAGAALFIEPLQTCQGVASEGCAKQTGPVCATLGTAIRCVQSPCLELKRTYKNACEACLDSQVIGYIYGACRTLNGQDEVAGPAELPVSLPGHGELVFKLPGGWSAKVKRTIPYLPPTIVMKSQAAHLLHVSATPTWFDEDEKPPTLDQIRKSLKDAAKDIQPRAVEKNLALKSLTGHGMKGFYFLATDRHPEPDGYQYMAQGAFLHDGLLVSFTVLANGKPEASIGKAFHMFRQARHRASQ